MKLSIIIATYKRQELLKKAVESVLRQDFKDFEIIISDDNSNDGTKELVEALQKKDTRIKYVLNSRYKQGPNGNKNNGLDYASGEFIGFLDDDDEMLEGTLSLLMQKANEGYSHIFGNCVIEKDGVPSEEFSGKGLMSDCEVSKKDFLMQKFHGEFLSIFKKSLLKNQRFNEDFYGNEATLWVNLYEEKSFYIHKALRIYRIKREDSVTLGAQKHAFRVYLGYLELAKILENELKNDEDYRGVCANCYKMAAYYAKFANEYKKMYACLFKSLGVKLNAPAFILLLLSVVPSKAVACLSKLRVALCKN
ncbi:GalNAc(5)-diNAcBac-PP-undecaprenol beta-1,3-glucosyltransferase [Campylobacter helveticus]|uniref:GalNAc(5)-diNAcBac-PP-undecaprenol beta-1,3-glucosyltransferase n=1 Tax=Campylobacter helveticus TaxID=28898 RepID=UPI001046E8CA|nr:glycosyltransferase family 2 protein [Campylobacter helveticus]QBL11689.1 glycosyltransferase family 2 protein [Campylobacter helveticus]